MSGVEWAAVITAVVGGIVAVGKGVGWLITLIVDQARQTVNDQKDTIDRLNQDVEYWRELALRQERRQE